MAIWYVLRLLMAAAVLGSGVSPGQVPSIPATNGLPDKITILGQELVLKNEGVDADGGFLAEYIPSFSTWDDWTLLFAIRIFPGPNFDPDALAQEKVGQILAMKQTQPLSNGQAWKKPDGKTALADFIECSPDFTSDLHHGLMEHNFWRYSKVENGVLAYQIARRIYASKSSGEEMLAFIKSIRLLRGSIFTEIDNPRLPIPVLAPAQITAPVPVQIAVPGPAQITLAPTLAAPPSFSGMPPIRIGDEVSEVQAALKTNTLPQPMPEQGALQRTKTFIHLRDQGVWVFFNQIDVVETIGFDAPFAGTFSGIKIGDSLDKVTAALGQPLKTPWASSAGEQAYLYPVDSITVLHLDIDDATRTVQHILITSSSRLHTTRIKH